MQKSIFTMCKTIIIFLIVILLPASVFALEKSRFRILGNFSESTKLKGTFEGPPLEGGGDFVLETEILDETGAKGGSLRYIYPSGFGIGITNYQVTLITQLSFTSNNVPTPDLGDLALAGTPFLKETFFADLTFLDISFTVGENFSFTPGAGLLIKHSQSHFIDAYDPLQEAIAMAGGTLNDVSLEPEIAARSIFIEFGYDFSGFELVIGNYRILLQFAFDPRVSPALGNTFSFITIGRDDVKVTMDVIYAGVGFTF